MNIENNSMLMGIAHEGSLRSLLDNHAAMTEKTNSTRTRTESISSNTPDELSVKESFVSVVAETIALFVVLLLAVSIIVIWAATFCYTRFGWICCLPGSASDSRNDQILAAQHRQELAQQTSETAAKQKQTKRIEAYQQFLKTNSRVVQPQDLIGQTSEHSHKCEAVDNNDTECSASSHSKNEDVMIQFTVPNNDEEHGTELRTGATCCICLKQYQPGESIVWSASVPLCRHVYHADCMLIWFAKGKKRCPVCRKHFFPSKRAGVAALALSHLDSSMSQSSRANRY
jgi:Ring finger domain